MTALLRFTVMLNITPLVLSLEKHFKMKKCFRVGRMCFKD